jgi:hypothetical protein
LSYNWNKIFIGYRRDSLIIRGAEGANPEVIGTKLSGKRTVTYLNPGKLPVHDRDTEGEKSRSFEG